MYKNNLISLGRITYSLIVVLCFVLLQSCSLQFKEEIALVEDLQEKLLANRENIDLDATDFKARVDEIKMNTSFLKVNYTDSISLEFGNQMDKYRGLKKIYQFQSGTLSECQKEQEALEKQLDNLLHDLKKGKLSKEEFKTYYKKEKTDVEQLLDKSKNIEKKLVEVEPEFRRISQWVYAEIEKLKD